MAGQPPTGDDPPAWVGEGVHLCASDPGWPARADPGDRERYTDEKAAFVTRTLRDLNAP